MAKIKLTKKQLEDLRNHPDLKPLFDNFYSSGVEINDKFLEAMGTETYDPTSLLADFKLDIADLDINPGDNIELFLPHNNAGIYVKSKVRLKSPPTRKSEEPSWLFIKVDTINMYTNSEIKFITSGSYINEKYHHKFLTHFGITP